MSVNKAKREQALNLLFVFLHCFCYGTVYETVQAFALLFGMGFDDIFLTFFDLQSYSIIRFCIIFIACSGLRF